ncbi:YkvA family protein [Billgrantia lactosivorans]|uniref:YkvA family protein n=1 Tax=Billgrantia lactosivorans TaxID=2185141 RepID=UPI001FEC2E0C|nr:YkvA family protein [Halomonas lactosivorans]
MSKTNTHDVLTSISDEEISLSGARATMEDIPNHSPEKKEHEQETLPQETAIKTNTKSTNEEKASEEINREISENEKNYSDEGFWKKVTKYAKKAGEKTLSPAMKLYYSAQDPDTPTWAKTTMYGALGYFISPVDAIPDLTPVLGYTDDIGILVGAIGVVAAHIKDEHAEKAKETLLRWFS